MSSLERSRGPLVLTVLAGVPLLVIALSAYLDSVQGGWWVDYWRSAEIAAHALSVAVAMLIGLRWVRRRGQMPGLLVALNVGLLALVILTELLFWGWVARVAWDGSRERPALIWLTVAACCFLLAFWPHTGWLISSSIWSDGLGALAVLALGAFAWRFKPAVAPSVT